MLRKGGRFLVIISDRRLLFLDAMDADDLKWELAELGGRSTGDFEERMLDRFPVLVELGDMDLRRLVKSTINGLPE